MRVASKIGEPEAFLDAQRDGRRGAKDRRVGGEEAKRYAPFCGRSRARLVLLRQGRGKRSSGDRTGRAARSSSGRRRPRTSSRRTSASGSTWSPTRARSRSRARRTMPQRLEALLYELGFRFDVSGRRAPRDGRRRGDRGAHRRRSSRATFAATSTASSTRAARRRSRSTSTSSRSPSRCARASSSSRPRTSSAGSVTSATRTSSATSSAMPSHPDNVRDLRRAPREPPLVLRGVLHVAAAVGEAHVFRAASGASADGLLPARAHRVDERARAEPRSSTSSTAIVHERAHDRRAAQRSPRRARRHDVGPRRTTARASASPAGTAQRFPLAAPDARARRGGTASAAAAIASLVWGAGALLEFDGTRFVPFEPDAHARRRASRSSRSPRPARASRCSSAASTVGAVARFDGRKWQPITEDHVIEATLADLDVWRGVAYRARSRGRRLDRVERAGSRGRCVVGHDAPGVPHRSGHAAARSTRCAASTAARSSRATAASSPSAAAIRVFHAAPGATRAARASSRVGSSTRRVRASDRRASRHRRARGPNAWIWENGAFTSRHARVECVALTAWRTIDDAHAQKIAR